MTTKVLHRNDGRGPEGFLKRLQEMEAKMPVRAVVEVSSTALQKNFRVIQELVPHQSLLPMLKANAYGHGIGWAARTLFRLRDLYGFGVATLEEAAEVRLALGPFGQRVRIIVFLETIPWTPAVGQVCEKQGFTAVIGSESDWRAFLKGGWPSRVSYELHFNTGMNRLGIPHSLARRIAMDLKGRPSTEHPAGISSHLAMSEQPNSKLNRTQVERFTWIRSQLGATLPNTRFHLANSGGIWNHKFLGLRDLTDVVRPGIALYGVPPWPDAPKRGILPVLTFRAGVIGTHRLNPGDSIGYGGTYKVKGAEPVHAAILGAGYADGVLRSLSNQGHAWLDGKLSRFLGVVSMDSCAVRCAADTAVGSWAELIGPEIDLWAQAKAAGTIPYELLTSISSRVKRLYEPGT